MYIGPPNLRDNLLIKLKENSENVPVDLRQEPVAFPDEPISFSWVKDGQLLTQIDHPLTHSNVTFDTVSRADTGTYTASATNFAVPNFEPRLVGSDTGSFYLDVICNY